MVMNSYDVLKRETDAQTMSDYFCVRTQPFSYLFQSLNFAIGALFEPITERVIFRAYHHKS